MARLEASYDIPEGVFPSIASRISTYLTPQAGKKISVATACELEGVRGVLQQEKSIKLGSVTYQFAGYYAMDLGLFPIQDREQAREFCRERYWVPTMPGCTGVYVIEIFGKNVTTMGDDSMVIRMEGDSRGHDDELSMLESWYKRFLEVGASISDEIIDVGMRYKEASAEHSALLASMPRSVKDFEKRIEEGRARVINAMVVWSINMTRFFWDFLGKPIREGGYSPMSIKFQGEGMEILLSETDREVIIAYPTLPIRDVVGRIFPKHPDDVKMI